MVESVLKSWDEIESILSDRDYNRNENDLDYLTALDRTMLEQIYDILKPLRQAILEVETSTRYPTSPLVALIYQKLSTSFDPEADDEEWIRVLKKKLLDSVRAKLIVSQEHRIATVLHPSFRLLEVPIIKSTEKQQTYNAIRTLLDPGSTATTNPVENIVDGPSLPEKRSRVSADSFLDDYCTANGATANNELDQYLSDSVTKVKFADVLEWWKVASNTYPKLALLARKFLAIPATSASSESAFRYAGLTVTDLRNRLSPETVSDLLFIHHFDKD